jgi:lincosamide nucleotidyltransferase A/C/D/E
MSLPQTQMTVKDVLEIIDLFAFYKVDLWIDGGWGVDALLGKQTRDHADLDIAMHHMAVPLIRRLLTEKGYADVPRDDTRDCNFVMGDDLGHLVDFHTFTYDDQGILTFGLPYPLESLTGTGFIENLPVRCISPEWMVKFHTGYAVDENDYHDVKALCDQFAIVIPEDYAFFGNNE